MVKILLKKKEELLAQKQILMNTAAPQGLVSLSVERHMVLNGKLQLIEDILKEIENAEDA